MEKDRINQAMALGRRKPKQDELFIPTTKLAVGPGHPFYTKLNEVLAQADFDPFVEGLCAKYYKKGGRPGIAPGVYFRMLLIGYFEGLDSQRGIAWRCADSLGLRSFLGVALSEDTPVHASPKNGPTCWRVVPWMRVSATFFSQSERNRFCAARLSKLRPLTALFWGYLTPASTLPLCRGMAGLVGRMTVP